MGIPAVVRISPLCLGGGGGEGGQWPPNIAPYGLYQRFLPPLVVATVPSAWDLVLLILPRKPQNIYKYYCSGSLILWLGGGEGTTVFSRDRRISLIMNQHLVFTWNRSSKVSKDSKCSTDSKNVNLEIYIYRREKLK